MTEEDRLSRDTWVAAASCQVSSSFLSFLASSILVICILKSNYNTHPCVREMKGGIRTCIYRIIHFETPYKRLIFSISISDLLQSLGFLIGPFIVPASDDQGYWAVGNRGTCIFGGLILYSGFIWVSLYSGLLSIYYYCKLYKKMSDEDFYYKVERKMHYLIILYVVILNTAALSTNAINTGNYSNFCGYNATPRGCTNSDVECDKNRVPAMIFMFLSIIIIPCLTLIIIIVCFSFILWNITFRERIFQKNSNMNSVSFNDAEVRNDVNCLFFINRDLLHTYILIISIRVRLNETFINNDIHLKETEQAELPTIKNIMAPIYEINEEDVSIGNISENYSPLVQRCAP